MTTAAAVAAVRARSTLAPEVAVILGTGLGRLAAELDVEASIPYAAIPGFAPATVETHAGRLLLGRLGGRRLVVMQGRLHAYEGYQPAQLAFPVRVMQALGATTLIVSNVSGGMRADWRVGDLVLIADHINLQGDNPLAGADPPGPRFIDLAGAYDAGLLALARDVARAQGVTLREGVYVAVQGPNLETRAEYRLLRTLGADIVGMSTVPEVIVARQHGLRVLGLSIITDLCLPDTLEPASLERIVAAAAGAEPALTSVVRGVLERLN